MHDEKLTVAEDVDTTTTGMLTDDASAMEEVSIEDLVADMTTPEHGETVENGDNGHTESEETEVKQPAQKEAKDKFSRRISAALRNQEGQMLHELGRGKLTRQQIIEAVDEHLARKMHEEDADISPKAAKKIIEAEAKAAVQPTGTRVDELRNGLRSMLDDGWTTEEITAFASDETVREDIAAGKTVRQAARAYERRAREAVVSPKTERKRAVPTAKGSGMAAETMNENYIEEMTPEQFAAFRAKVRKAQMQGKQVRL